MIGSERDALIDLIPREKGPSRLQGPLATLGLLLAVWITGRAVLWENPLPSSGIFDQAAQLLAQAPNGPNRVAVRSGTQQAEPPSPMALEATAVSLRQAALATSLGDTGPGPAFRDGPIDIAQAHELLYRAALQTDLRGSSWRTRRRVSDNRGLRQAGVPVFPGAPPFSAPDSRAQTEGSPSRWSLDVWAFGREGSQSAPISEGRVPVYGASQLGANLQFRIAPANPRDPRAYLRAYRALIERPENELALGVSARPIGSVPVRVAAEIRGTENQFGSDVRPAALAITEIPPVALPLGFSGELYAGAGYVGGDTDTAFIDGQGTITRRVASFDLRNPDAVRISVGAGAWGGAQRDAHRIDVGPTVRLDLAIGDVPARFSVDYRERVGGDAAPESGVAATLSTQF